MKRTWSPGPGKRILARVLDAVIVGIPASILLAVIGLPAPTIGLGGTEAWAQSAITAGLWFLYYVAFEAVTGATLAKRVMNMRVISDTEGAAAAGLGPAALRNSWILLGLVPAIGGVLLFGAVVWIGVSIGRNNKGIHDRLAGTAVIGVP